MELRPDRDCFKILDPVGAEPGAPRCQINPSGINEQLERRTSRTADVNHGGLGLGSDRNVSDGGHRSQGADQHNATTAEGN
jgi:hypothetical protein